MNRAVLGDVVLRFEAGRSPKTLERLAEASEPGVLKVSAVSWGRFDASAAKAVSQAVDLLEEHSVKCGDLLISRANTLELVGAVAIAEATYSNRFLSDKTLRLVPIADAVITDFLLYALRRDEARRHIQRSASGTSDSMRNISQGALLKTPIPLPPIPEQGRIAAQIRHQLVACETAKRAAVAQLEIIDRLPQRILAATFGDA